MTPLVCCAAGPENVAFAAVAAHGRAAIEVTKLLVGVDGTASFRLEAVRNILASCLEAMSGRRVLSSCRTASKQLSQNWGIVLAQLAALLSKNF